MLRQNVASVKKMRIDQQYAVTPNTHIIAKLAAKEKLYEKQLKQLLRRNPTANISKFLLTVKNARNDMNDAQYLENERYALLTKAKTAVEQAKMAEDKCKRVFRENTVGKRGENRMSMGQLKNSENAFRACTINAKRVTRAAQVEVRKYEAIDKKTKRKRADVESALSGMLKQRRVVANMVMSSSIKHEGVNPRKRYISKSRTRSASKSRKRSVSKSRKRSVSKSRKRSVCKSGKKCVSKSPKKCVCTSEKKCGSMSPKSSQYKGCTKRCVTSKTKCMKCETAECKSTKKYEMRKVAVTKKGTCCMSSKKRGRSCCGGK